MKRVTGVYFFPSNVTNSFKKKNTVVYKPQPALVCYRSLHKPIVSDFTNTLNQVLWVEFVQ